jgi:endo-1,4-beta-xylanase
MISRRAWLAGAASLSLTGAAPTATLASLAKRRNLLFGTAVTETDFACDPAYHALVAREAALVTPERLLKWGPLRPTPDRFDFAPADRFFVNASRAGLRVRGHNLLWHVDLPEWLTRCATRSDFAAAVHTHIATVCARYAGRVHAWDVVNEPICVEDGRSDGLRATPFLRAQGPAYIDQALRIAARADPSAILVINEMDVECDGDYFERRRVALLALLTRLRADGAPLHAVGIESHLKWRRCDFDAARFAGFLAAIARLGLRIHLTELDIADTVLPADIARRDQAVADLTRRYLETALLEPAVDIVSVWELTDRCSWLSTSPWTRRSDGLPSRGCLYDANLAPKPSRDAVARVLA